MSGARLRLDCRGVVQGVGFRPAIHRLARRLGLAGTLHNASGLVQLDLHGDRRDLERFLHDLPAALPPGARLEPLEPRWLPAAPEFFPLPGESGPGPMNSAASGDPTEALVAGSGATRREDRNSAPSPGNADPSVVPTLDQPCSLAPRRIAAPGLTISAADPDPASPLTIGLIAPSLVADRAPCAADVLDDHRLPESVGCIRLDFACKKIRGATRWVGHDQADRFDGVVLCPGGAQGAHGHEQAAEKVSEIHDVSCVLKVQ